MKKYFFLFGFALIFFLGYSLYEFISFNDNKLHLIFCNVGQGDGIVIITPEKLKIIVDGGPDSSILSCLSKHLPFWERDIDMIILTHPHADHLNGLINILKRYSVSVFITEKLANKTIGYSELFSMLKSKKIAIKDLYAGDRFHAGGVLFSIVGPTKKFLSETSPNGIIGENKEFASLESLISYKKFNALLTGDSQADELKDALSNFSIPKLSVLQTPHHGCATGLNKDVLKALNPLIAVISVGKNNHYGHPSPITLNLFKLLNIKYFRTDQLGDIEAVSDGDRFSID